MEHAKQDKPESVAVEAMRLSDKKYIIQAIAEYPANEHGHFSGIATQPGEYWGMAVALTCAKFGVPLGFKETEEDIALTASSEAGNYWLNLSGYEHRMFGGGGEKASAETESRSGIFTMLHEPSTGRLFEHVYALHTQTELVDIMQRDPMFAETRINQAATFEEIIDHDGVVQLYEEDAEKCVRLYLTRALPHLKYLRDTIKNTKRFAEVHEIRDEYDDRTKAMMARINEQNEPHRAFNQARLEYWQTEYDFTVGLLMEGYKPYDLSEVAPMVEEYVVGLLAFHPELSPADLQVEVPDIKKKLTRFVADMERRERAAEN